MVGINFWQFEQQKQRMATMAVSYNSYCESIYIGVCQSSIISAHNNMTVVNIIDSSHIIINNYFATDCTDQTVSCEYWPCYPLKYNSKCTVTTNSILTQLLISLYIDIIKLATYISHRFLIL